MGLQSVGFTGATLVLTGVFAIGRPIYRIPLAQFERQRGWNR